MNLFLQRFIIFLGAAILQRSGFDIIWPNFQAPAIMIALVVSLVFILGFEQGLAWSLLAVLIYSLLGRGDLFVVYAVVVAYGTSFLSRRLVIERTLESGLVLAITSVLFTLLFYGVLFGVAQETLPTFMMMILNALQTLLVFPIVFILLQLWERRVRNSFMSQFRGLRT